jgi:hypothetical protein
MSLLFNKPASEKFNYLIKFKVIFKYLLSIHRIVKLQTILMNVFNSNNETLSSLSVSEQEIKFNETRKSWFIFDLKRRMTATSPWQPLKQRSNLHWSFWCYDISSSWHRGNFEKDLIFKSSTVIVTRLFEKN